MMMAMADQPKLLDRTRNAIRARHYSRRTEEAYVMWIKRYIFFHGKRHPRLVISQRCLLLRKPPTASPLGFRLPLQFH